MKFICPKYQEYLLRPFVIIQHNGLELLFDVSNMSKINFNVDFDMFYEINEYIERQPQDFQDQLFGIYKEFSTLFESFQADIQQPTTDIVTRLYKLLDYNKFFTTYVKPNEGVRYKLSKDLPDNFSDVTGYTYTRDKTYTRTDYMELIALILMFRFMIPIWGHYLKLTMKTSGTTFKEYNALKLIVDSPLVDVPPMKKLITYVRQIVGAAGKKSATLMLLTSEEYPIWSMSIMLVRRLCMNDIRGHDPSPIIIRHISRHIRERHERADAAFGGPVSSKDESTKTTNNSDDQQISKLEEYKVKEPISDGNLAFLEYSISDPYLVAQRMCPGVPKELVDKALTHYASMNQHNPMTNEGQRILCAWMLSNVVSPVSINYINRIEKIKCLCVAHAALWHTNHWLMAALATAVPAPTSEYMLLAESDSRGRLTRDIKETIAKLYPYDKKGRLNKENHLVTVSIDKMVNSFSECTWMSLLDEEDMKLVNPKSNISRRIVLPHNFKVQVATLCIDIVTRFRGKTLEEVLDVHNIA